MTLKKAIFLTSELLFIVCAVVTPAICAESTLDHNALDTISNAVFEIVVPKPTVDSLTYENPLPLYLLPYAIRTDKYYSIGTAFALGPNRFISAAHVMNLGLESQFSEACLRDKDGNVYAIDKILNYSERKDFIIFTLKNKTAKEFFDVNTKPARNSKVYAVGNALGEGIVVRDGLYTSDTPEERVRHADNEGCRLRQAFRSGNPRG